MEFIYITNDPHRAITAQLAGVDKIMVDLEINGKLERQSHLNTVISRHTMKDVTVIRNVLKSSKLMVRVNPIHNGSNDEISKCIDLGAEILMLSMFTTPIEVQQFIKLVSGRVKTCLLLETSQALVRVDEITRISGIDEIHIGLNDLHLAMKLDFMFELLSGGIVEYLATCLHNNKINFGFGGIARLGYGTLTSELVLSEHHRLGSTQVILSRDFNKVYDGVSTDGGADLFCEEVHKIRQFIDKLHQSSSSELMINSSKLKKIVHNIVNTKYLAEH